MQNRGMVIAGGLSFVVIVLGVSLVWYGRKPATPSLSGRAAVK